MPLFALSTHLFHGERLTRAHVDAIREHGFEAVEVFATRTHFDYHDRGAIDEAAGWLREAGVRPISLHLPICEGFTAGVWGRAYSNASKDTAARDEAVFETRVAMEAAARLECAIAVLHLGLPTGQPIPANDNDPGALRRSLEPIAQHAASAGVRLALEVIPNDLSTPGALLDWLDGDLDLDAAGVCLDVGHAHLLGGAPEAAEALGGWVITTHLHDNRGRADDHLLPFQGTIDWPATLMAMSKVGFAGPLVFEVADQGKPHEVLSRAVGARARLQGILDDLAAPFSFDET